MIIVINYDYRCAASDCVDLYNRVLTYPGVKKRESV